MIENGSWDREAVGFEKIILTLVEVARYLQVHASTNLPLGETQQVESDCL